MARAKKKRVKAGTGKAAAAARRVAFVEAYIANGRNGTEAAIAAGFSPHSAHSRALELVKDREVIEMIEERHEALSVITGLDQVRTLREVARIAYSDPRKLFTETGSLKEMSELDDDCAAIVASVETEQVKSSGEGGDGALAQTKKLKLWDKNAALEKAMKFHGLYEKDNLQAPKPIHITMVFE